jgi:GYF domain 2
MTDGQWYTGRDGRQEGPFGDERLRQLIATGVVRADTLVWTAGMTNWAKAAEVPGLMPAQRAPSVASGAAGGGGTGPLSLDVGVWALFWRGLVLAFSELAVIPLPWVAPIFIRWFVERMQLPGGQRIGFVGKAEDIWWIFILYALVAVVGIAYSPVQLVSLFLQPFLLLLIVRWFFAHLTWEGQTQTLRFTGGYWPLLGWSLLLALSIISVIGWAWVATAWGRWMCRNVQGSSRELIFTASGLGYLWRALVLALTAIFIIPIPWTAWWFTGWCRSSRSSSATKRSRQASTFPD